MTWSRRKASEHDLYHVTIRGSGRQIIFEDDTDRRRFLDTTRDLAASGKVQLVAWCLMGNHVHLLLRVQLPDLSVFMRKLVQSYAMYFNKRHDRVGHLTQGRYGSVPIENDAQLLQTARYIHLNPAEAGISNAAEYPWSSYREYLSDAGGGLCDTSLLLGMLGGVDGFIRFHAAADRDDSALSRGSRSATRLTDSQARQLLGDVLASSGLAAVPVQDKAARDAVLAALRRRGLSIRQIERLTGIGRNIIERAR